MNGASARGLPWDAETAAAIGADWLLAEIEPAGDFGRRARLRERRFGPGDEVAARAAIEGVARVAAAVSEGELAALAAALAALPDPSAAFASAAAGGTLDDGELFDVRRFLDGLAELSRVGLAGSSETIPAPPADLLATFAPTRLPGRGFYLADALDPELAAARGTAAAAEARYAAERGRLRVEAARFAGTDVVRDGEFVVLRSAASGEAPTAVRIVREAATYRLCELALDDAGLAALAEREAAGESVAAAEEAARATLSARTGERAAALLAATESIGRLDALVARARFARRHACVVPEIATAAEVRLAAARHLPLEAELGRRGEPYVALDLTLAGIGIVTGANMGGKTAALRTLGFACACAALGVPVPAAAASVPLPGEIAWLGVGGTEPQERLLSAFGREVVALRRFLERGSPRPLVLIDEFARTTAPREGRALLVAAIDRLRRRGAFGLAATHLEGVAEASGAAAFAVGGLLDAGDIRSASEAPLSLDAALGRIARLMDRRLLPVAREARPASDALALAALLGLDDELLARARVEAAEPGPRP